MIDKSTKRHRRRITEVERAEMIRLYNDGETFTVIAQTVGTHRQTARNYLTQHGYHIPDPRRRHKTAAQRAAIVNLYERGVTVENIKDRFHCSYSTIYRYLHKHNVILRTEL